MSVSSGPPELPPDSPGSSVSSRLQVRSTIFDWERNYFVSFRMNIQTLLIVLLSWVTMDTELPHQWIHWWLVQHKQSRNDEVRRSTTDDSKRFSLLLLRLVLADPSNDLIDLSSPNSPRTNSDAGKKQLNLFSVEKMFSLETFRNPISQIPSLEQLLSADHRALENQALSKDFDDPLVPHLVRYSELVSNDLESKPINEKMDHWYLDMKKNLMVKHQTSIDKRKIMSIFFFLEWIR